MNQSTPGLDTATPGRIPTQDFDKSQYEAQVPKVLYPNLSELTQSQVEIVQMVESPQIGTDQLPLIQTSEQTVFQYRLLRLIAFQLYAMILGCLLSLNSFFSQMFIIENSKHPGQFQINWCYYVVTVLQFYSICLIPLVRTKTFIIRRQKLICRLQLIIQVPFFIGLCRIFTIYNREAIIYLLLILSFGIIQYQRYSIVTRRPKLSLTCNYHFNLVLRQVIYSLVGINFFLAIFGVDMKQIVITQSFGLYLIYYFIQLNDSLTENNVFKALWPSIVQYFRSQYPAEQQVEHNQLIRTLKNIRNVLAIFGGISLYIFFYWVLDFHGLGFIVWAILANTQVINASAKVDQKDYHLASVLVLSDVVNFVPNVVRSLQIKN